MKIGQFYDEGGVHLGVVEAERIIPMSFSGDMLDYIRSPVPLEAAGAARPLEEVRWAPAVLRPSKIIAIGLNYRDHAEESKGRPPGSPLIFAKFPSSLAAHGETVIWEAAVTSKVDFEAELAVIVGSEARNLRREEALGAVFGFTCANDVSARDLQFGDKQWVRGKSLDTFCPLGPWVVTVDAFDLPLDLEIQCHVNGQVMQTSRTSRMIFDVSFLMAFLSRHFTLLPGDVILTGTPSGVGAFRDPPVYLGSGDEVAVSIEGIGRLVNRCRVC